MKARLLYLLLWLLSSASPALIAQGLPAKIVDPGELFAHYNWDFDEEGKAYLRKQLGEDLLAKVIDYSQESRWPAGLRTQSDRNENKALFGNIKAYYLLTFSIDKALLRIPATENRHLPAYLQPEHDLFFIVGETGVEWPGHQAGPLQVNRIPVRITSATGIFPAFQWQENLGVLNELRNTLGPRADEVMAYSREEQWPSGLRTAASRQANLQAISEYKAYLLTLLPKNLAVLVIPAVENRIQPAPLQPARDIYFILPKYAIEEQEQPANPEIRVSAGTGLSFTAQLTQIIEDFPNNFANMKGDAIEQELQVEQHYRSRMPLANARETYFDEPKGGSRLSFVASFPQSGRMEEALELYRNLVQQIDQVRLSGLRLMKNNEVTSQEMRSTSFFPFDFTGDLDPRFKTMLLEVRLVKSFDRIDNQMVPVWYPALTIYNR